MENKESEYMSITSENISYMDTLEKNAELYIYEYFEDIKRKVYTFYIFVKPCLSTYIANPSFFKLIYFFTSYKNCTICPKGTIQF